MSLLPVLLLGAILGGQEQAVFRVETYVVRADVFVGRNGRAVSGLGAEDFEVYDDGERVPVHSVAVEDTPLNVLLVLDTSTSVAGPTLGRLQSAARAFLTELSPDDRVGLLTFSHHLDLRSPLSADLGALAAAVEELVADGSTSWRDALFAALEMLELVRDRPMVVLFTDGADTYSWLMEEQVAPLVHRSNAVIYAIARERNVRVTDLNTSRGMAQWRESRRVHMRRTRLLREVTAASGGRLIESSSTERLQEIFLEILREMKTRYILSFTPRAPIREGWHDLEIKVKRRGVDVHARRGYLYEAKP